MNSEHAPSETRTCRSPCGRSRARRGRARRNRDGHRRDDREAHEHATADDLRQGAGRTDPHRQRGSVDR